jgi:beta-mannanase
LENWKPSTSANWAQIANGAADGNIDRLATYIKANFRQPFFLTVWHEPENDVNPTAGSGMTAKDFHDMFRHTVLRLRADGVTNAVTVANFQSYPAYSATDWWADLYPGDDVVDWVAEDSYNQGYTDGGKMSGDFAATVNKPKDAWTGFYNWAHANHPDKPVMLAEWGVFERADSPGRQAWFFDDVKAHLADFPQLKAMVYFDSPQAPKGSTNFDQDAGAPAAFKSLINTTKPISF